MLYHALFRSLSDNSRLQVRNRRRAKIRGDGARTASLLVGMILASFLPNAVHAAEESPDKPAPKVPETQQRGSDFLRKSQTENGTWSARDDATNHVTATALCTLALLKTNGKPDDEAIQKALAALRDAQPASTSEIALQTQVFSAAEPKKDLPRIQRNVEQLEKLQIAEGEQRGGWSSDGTKQPTDSVGSHFNSSLAIWALDEAAYAGATVKPETWAQAADFTIRSQGKDGSWDTTHEHRQGSRSMTCAAMASLMICFNRIPQKEFPVAGATSLNRGIAWLEDNFVVDHAEPKNVASALFHLVQLRRLGELTGIQIFRYGERSPLQFRWYKELSAQLRMSQAAEDGSWNVRELGPTLSTALALLVLQTGPPSQFASEADRVWGLDGAVIDELNQPVPDCMVFLSWELGTRRRSSYVYTDSKGRFQFVSPPPYFIQKILLLAYQQRSTSQFEYVKGNTTRIRLPRYGMLIPGIWEVVSWQDGGRKLKPEESGNREVFITVDDVVVWDGDGKVSDESYSIDASVKPQQIDLQRDGNRTPAIFQLKEDRLTLCLNRGGGQRPEKFETSANSPDVSLVELKRFDSANAIKQLNGFDAAANARIVHALGEQTELECVDLPLKDAINFLSDLHDIDTELDAASLKKAGVDPDMPVTLTVRGVTLYDVLRILLKPVKLRFELDDGKLVIRSRRGKDAD